MNKYITRISGAILTLVLILGLLPAGISQLISKEAASQLPLAAQETFAAGETEVSDVEMLKKYLAQDGDVSIKLTKDIDKKYGNDEWETNYKDVWITIGKGNKTLNLNGHDIEITVNNCYYRRPYLFKVPTGATFTIDDTTGLDGTIHFEGYMYSATHGTAGLHKANLEYNQVRNGFRVDGGNLIFNGGTLEGGRSKEQYIGFGRAASFYGENEDNWFHSAGRRDGYVRQQIGCNGIYMTSGSTIINGGTIEGRGYQELKFSMKRVKQDVHGYMDDFEWWDYDIDMTDSAGIKATGGSLTINNGSVWGYGNADCLRISDEVSVSVKSGTFQCHHLGKLVVPGPFISGKLDSDKVPVLIFDGGDDSHASYGYIGLKYDWIDRNKSDVYVSGEKKNPENWSGAVLSSKKSGFYDHNGHYKTEVKTRDDLAVPVYNASTNTEVTDYISWNMTGDSVYYIPIEQTYWAGYTSYRGPYYSGYLGISKEKGVTSAVSIGYGGKEQANISSGGSIVNTVKELSIKGNNTGNYFTDSSGNATIKNPTRMQFSLSEIIPADAKLGDSFMLSIESAQYILGSDYYPAATLKNKKVIEVRLEQKTPVVTQQPTSDHHYSGSIHKVDTKGDTVTFTAAADNATGAYWKRTYPNDGMTFTGTFDPATGVATLEDYPVMESNDLVCIFTNEHGETVSDKIRVFYQPTAQANSDYINLTWYTSRAQGVITPEGLNDFNPEQLSTSKWLYCLEGKDPKIGSNWKELDGAWDSSVTGKQCKFYYNGSRMLWMSDPKPSNSGYYKFKTWITQDGVGWEYESPVYHVRVIDGSDPVHDITSVTILGLDNRYYGDEIPSADDIVVDDDDRGVVRILSHEWTAGVKNGRFRTSEGTPTLKLELQLPEGGNYYFRNDDSTGRFTCYYPGDKEEQTISGSSVKRITVTVRLSGMDTPRDKVIFDQTYFSLYAGDTIDIQLSDIMNFYCHERHIAAGNEHQVTGYYVYDAGRVMLNGLGLTMDSTGHITGTAKGNPSDGWRPVTIYCRTSPAQDPDPSYMFYFFVNPKPNTKKLDIPKDFAALTHQHTWGAWKDKGDGYHVRTCTSCGSEESVAHFWDDGVVTKAATGSAAGIMTYTCTDCGAKKTETIDKHTIIHVNEVASTCVVPGAQAHYECSDCGMAFKDAAGTQQIEDTSTIALALADHDWGAWKVTKEATATAAGEMVRTCKNNPSHTETAVIPAGKKTVFPDVADPSKAYYKPVYWGVDRGIIQGYKNGNFGPADSCTRSQFVVMIWRFAGRPSATATVKFSDVDKSMSAYRAIQWAVENGIIVGYKDGTFKPSATVTRRQVCVMLWRWQGKPSASKAAPFVDLTRTDSAYRAVQWGAQAGVIKGSKDSSGRQVFKPDDNCQRQQIVTFLYRFARDVKGEKVN